MGVAVVREEQCSARLYDEGGSQQGCRRLCTQPRSCSKGILEAEGEFHCNIVGVVGEPDVIPSSSAFDGASALRSRNIQSVR